MNKRVSAWVLMLLLASASTSPAWAESDAALAKDLTTVITLLGLPCGEVASVKRQGDNDNVATCKDGNRYRVYLNAEGRVVAQKQ